MPVGDPQVESPGQRASESTIHSKKTQNANMIPQKLLCRKPDDYQINRKINHCFKIHRKSPHVLLDDLSLFSKDCNYSKIALQKRNRT